jgi:hypothetical protein
MFAEIINFQVLSSIPWNLGSVCLEFEAEVLEKIVIYHRLQYESFQLSCDNITLTFLLSMLILMLGYGIYIYIDVLKQCFFLDSILSNFNQKNMISTCCTEDFAWKKKSLTHQISKNFFSSREIFMISSNR